MFTKDGIRAMHGWTHESMDILLQHVSAVPDEMLRTPLNGFGKPTVWQQLVHILDCEKGWVLDLQDRADQWRVEDCETMAALLEAKEQIRKTTQAYVESLSEAQLNTTLAKRPKEWLGELRSPAYILLHVMTHAFHHKGQVVAMLRTVGYPAPDTDLQRG